MVIVLPALDSTKMHPFTTVDYTVAVVVVVVISPVSTADPDHQYDDV